MRPRESPFRAAASGPPFGGGPAFNRRPDSVASAAAGFIRALPALLIFALVVLSLLPHAAKRLSPRGLASPQSLRGTGALRGAALPPPRLASRTRVGICAPDAWCGAPDAGCDKKGGDVGERCPPPFSRAAYANYQAADLLALDA